MPFCRKARLCGVFDSARKERWVPISYPPCSLSFAAFASVCKTLVLHFSGSSTSPTSAIDYVVLGRMVSPGVRSTNPVRPGGNRVHSVDLGETRCMAPMAGWLAVYQAHAISRLRQSVWVTNLYLELREALTFDFDLKIASWVTFAICTISTNFEDSIPLSLFWPISCFCEAWWPWHLTSWLQNGIASCARHRETNHHIRTFCSLLFSVASPYGTRQTDRRTDCSA